MNKQQINQLIKEFKILVQDDVSGITAADARNTIFTWLISIGESELAIKFEDAIYQYQVGPKIRKMEEAYNKSDY
jgi:hypothetical protein